jgi:hypothetical protein
MSERRFALFEFTLMRGEASLQLYEAGRTYSLPQAVAHAAGKRSLVAAERPASWTPPSMFRPPEVLTLAEVAEADSRRFCATGSSSYISLTTELPHDRILIDRLLVTTNGNRRSYYCFDFTRVHRITPALE